MAAPTRATSIPTAASGTGAGGSSASVDAHAPGRAAGAETGDAGEGLVVVKRIDFSPICADNSDSSDDDGASAAEIGSLFCDPDLKIDVAGSLHVIVGFQQALYTNDEMANANTKTSPFPKLESMRRGSDASSVQVSLQSLELLIDGIELELDDDERITDVKWIGNDYFGVSYTSGVIRIFSHAGELVFDQVSRQSRKNACAVQTVHGNSFSANTPRAAPVCLL